MATAALPPDLLTAACQTGGVEVAWRRTDAIRAIWAYQTAGVAVLGGEAWVIDPDGSIRAVVPTTDGQTAVLGWTVEREPGEAWRRFCDRAADFGVKILSTPGLEANVLPEARPFLCYCLTEATEERFEALTAAELRTPGIGGDDRGQAQRVGKAERTFRSITCGKL